MLFVIIGLVILGGLAYFITRNSSNGTPVVVAPTTATGGNKPLTVGGRAIAHDFGTSLPVTVGSTVEVTVVSVKGDQVEVKLDSGVTATLSASCLFPL